MADSDAIKRLLERLQTGWAPQADAIEPVVPQVDALNWQWLKMPERSCPSASRIRRSTGKRPRVSAVAMTMVGARSATKGVKDRASQMYVERAYEVAAKHADLFDVDNPADAFVITDDFMSAGRISGALSASLSRN